MLTTEESLKIINHFGQDFYEKVLRDIDTYSKKWELDSLQLVNYFSVNCIFFCHSEYLGDSVLKIGNNSKELFTEVNTLLEYSGKQFCKVYESDIENGVMLLERIKPGIILRDEKSLDKRLSVFSDLFSGLHIEPKNPSLYPTYTDWISRITEYMSKKDYEDIFLHMKKVKEICMQVSDLYPEKMLLHGDIHHDNILLDNNNQYKIIDPKGVIGARVFDISRFISNELDDEITNQLYKKIVYIIDYFESSLHIPGSIIKQCFYIESALTNCWNIESNQTPNLDAIIMAEEIMNG